MRIQTLLIVYSLICSATVSAQSFPADLIKQSEAIKSIEVTFDLTETWEKGCLPTLDKNGKPTTFPSEKVSKTTTGNILRISGDKLWWTCSRFMYDTRTLQLEEETDKAYFDGNEGKDYWLIKNDPTNRSGIGHMNYPRGHALAAESFLLPMIWSVRGDRPSLLRTRLQDFKLTGQPSMKRGIACEEFLHQQRSVYLDVKKANPKELIEYRVMVQGQVNIQCKVADSFVQDGFTFPKSWALTIYHGKRIERTMTYTVRSVVVNQPIAEELFEFKFPIGMSVVDVDKDETYDVQPNGLLMSVRPQFGKGASIYLILGISIAILIVTFFVVRYFRRRRRSGSGAVS